MRACAALSTEQEGFGLSWNARVEGLLVSASLDRTICEWDVNQHSGTPGAVLDALCTHVGHNDVVEDVQWHPMHEQLFGSVGDDGRLCLWDTRHRGRSGAPYSCCAHQSEVNVLSFSPFNENLVATGSSDGTVGLFDLRNLNDKVHALTGHAGEVFNVEWSPHHEAVLASSSERRIYLWDLARAGAEQTALEAEDGPAELLFVHGGLTDTVSHVASRAATAVCLARGALVCAPPARPRAAPSSTLLNACMRHAATTLTTTTLRSR